VSLYWVGILPLWLLLLICTRDVIIVAGALGYFLGEINGASELIKPTLISKFNTVLQIGLVLFLLLIQFTIEFSEWLQIVFIIVATSTALSGADYMWLWIKKFILQESKK